MIIKVCGVTNRANMLGLAALRPHYLGFIFHPPSPRDVTQRLASLGVDSLPQSPKRVAVMVNQPLQYALGLVERWGFQAVQLHGEESPDYCRRLLVRCEVFKAFPVASALPQHMEAFRGCCTYILFDTATRQRGGSGQAFDHELLRGYHLPIPFMVSGGIGPSDAQQLVSLKARCPAMAGIDLNSRFETSPGIKDLEALRGFLHQIQP